MSELEKIQEQIESKRLRFSEIKQEIAGFESQLEIQRKEQGAAIVGKNDHSGPSKEIQSLTASISGAKEAQEQIREALKGLEAQKTALVRAAALEQAESKKTDILEIEADIYSLLVQAAQRLPDLYNSRGDYVAQLAAAGSKEAAEEGRKIVNLHEILRREIPNLLDHLARTVLLEELPSPNKVRDAIRTA